MLAEMKLNMVLVQRLISVRVELKHSVVNKVDKGHHLQLNRCFFALNFRLTCLIFR